MKHSTGDWRYSKEHQIVTTSPYGIVEGSKRIADCGNYLKPTEEVDANGYLLAASAQMYEALNDIRDFLKSQGFDLRIVDGALKAAKGDVK